MKKNWLVLGFMCCLPIPWLTLRFSGWDWQATPGFACLLSGLSIICAGFILCWAAEVAQKDISQALALTFLAIVAVLPEYVVDMYFAWMAGKDLHYISYATANMTGANRLLIGFGWSLMVIAWWIKSRATSIEIEESHKVEISFLTFATLYSFIIPIKGSISLIDAVILVFLFVFYIRRAAKAEMIEPELLGPAEEIGKLPGNWRRLVVISLFLYSGLVIFESAEPFAEGLIETGRSFGIEEFILIQWLAPLASESPEIIAATLFVLKAKPTMGLGTLISSKVNQWTLLVALLPVVFSISGGKMGAMMINERQIEEILLTSAQSVFGIAILANMSISIKEAALLFFLFFTQLLFPQKEIRFAYAFLYLSLAIIILIKDRRKARGILSFILRSGSTRK
jgi:cation:H+ antiporter